MSTRASAWCPAVSLPLPRPLSLSLSERQQFSIFKHGILSSPLWPYAPSFSKAVFVPLGRAFPVRDAGYK